LSFALSGSAQRLNRNVSQKWYYFFLKKVWWTELREVYDYSGHVLFKKVEEVQSKRRKIGTYQCLCSIAGHVCLAGAGSSSGSARGDAGSDPTFQGDR
jgi:hypothetical protein